MFQWLTRLLVIEAPHKFSPVIVEVEPVLHYALLLAQKVALEAVHQLAQEVAIQPVLDAQVHVLVVVDAQQLVRIIAQVVLDLVLVHAQEVAIPHVLLPVLTPVMLTIAIQLVLLHVLTAVKMDVKDSVKDVPLAPEDAGKVVPDAVQRARTNVQVVVVPVITHAPRPARQSAVRHATRPAHQPAWVWN